MMDSSLYGQDHDDGFFRVYRIPDRDVAGRDAAGGDRDSVTDPPAPGPPCPSPSHGFKFAALASPSLASLSSTTVWLCTARLASQPPTFRSFCTRPTAAGR